ncbi:MAG TPA: V-containing nitrogenase subunit delta [Rhodocyclaceae bacterium]|nr:V-containing nitrogenase subunit delta [Rhodocyclaceae bacterium]
MLEDKIDDVFDYVQERCLWQFFSRTWDRQENIDGVLEQATGLLTGKEVARETPMSRLHYADAKIMVGDLQERYPWVKEAGEQEIREVMDGLKLRLIDTAITRSTNRELNHHLY